MTAQLKNSLERIRSISPKLNKATETAAATIAEVEKFLVEECQLGISAGVYVGPGDMCDIRLEYRRINNRFRIAVVEAKWETREDENGNSYVAKDENGENQVSGVEDFYAWAESPRDMKLRTFSKLNDLLDNIAMNAEYISQDAEKVAGTADEVIFAMRSDSRVLKIDSGLLYSAISKTDEGLNGQGYLNRKDGSIVYVYDGSREDIESHVGKNAAADNAGVRKAVASAPKDWIAIPKYDSFVEGKNHEDEFIQSFLRKNSIQADLV